MQKSLSRSAARIILGWTRAIVKVNEFEIRQHLRIQIGQLTL